MARPYRTPASLILLMAIVPLYLVVAGRAREVVPWRPQLGLDALVPVLPAWALIYGALYLFLILLPVIVIQDEGLLRATVRGWLALWLTSYAIFWMFPTVAPRPPIVDGEGFPAWGLRFLYHADPPHNCFPSLHVAHTVLAAAATRRVHPGVGALAYACAALVALSTLFTKQHYVVDVLAGVGMALAMAHLALRRFPAAATTEEHRRVAPALAVFTAGIVALVFLVFVTLFGMGVELTSPPAF